MGGGCWKRDEATVFLLSLAQVKTIKAQLQSGVFDVTKHMTLLLKSPKPRGHHGSAVHQHHGPKSSCPSLAAGDEAGKETEDQDRGVQTRLLVYYWY